MGSCCAFQEGRSQCLAVLAADFCVAALRATRDVPFGMCYCDCKEAFDTQWRPSMQQKVVSCVEPRFWCLADELLHTTSMNVVCHGRRSRWFKTGTGVVEARRLSPLQFCLGQQRLESEAMASLTGVGVNPPLHALVAFHKHKASTPLGSYDLDEVHMLFNAVQASLMTWDDAMQRVFAIQSVLRSLMFQARYVETFDPSWMTPGFQFRHISMQLPHLRYLKKSL